MEEPEEDEEEEDDEVPLAKAAAAPSDEDLRKETLAILETVQLEDFTMKDLLCRLCARPFFDDLARELMQGVYRKVEDCFQAVVPPRCTFHNHKFCRLGGDP